MKREFKVAFKNLNDETQQKIIAETCEEDILWQGTKSKCLETRLLVQKNPATTSKMLEKMLKEAGKEDDKLVMEIIHGKRLVPTEELFCSLYGSPNFAIKHWIAIYTEDSDLLSVMMDDELSEDQSEEDVILAILFNKFYIQEKEQVIEAFEASCKRNRVSIAKFVNDEETLNELLKIEARTEKDVEVLAEILNNSSFIPEKDALEYLQENLYYDAREELVKKLTNAEIIDKMIEIEICDENDEDVLTALLENENCDVSETTKRMLVKEAKYWIRMKMAEECDDLDFLKEQLLIELENKDDKDVIIVILEKIAALEGEEFILTEELQEKLYHDENSSVRRWLAEHTKDRDSLVKMLRIEPNEFGGGITEKILNNINFRLKEEEMLEFSTSKFKAVRKYIAKSEETPFYILENMYLNEKYNEIIGLIMGNKNFVKEAKKTKPISIFKKKKMITILKEAETENPKYVLDKLLEVIEK